MATNEEIAKRIIDALEKKVGPHKSVCPICGGGLWRVQTRYTIVPATPRPDHAELGEEGWPLATMICDQCGNTQFINLLVLGFKRGDFDSMEFNREEDAKSGVSSKGEEIDSMKRGEKGK